MVILSWPLSIRSIIIQIFICARYVRTICIIIHPLCSIPLFLASALAGFTLGAGYPTSVPFYSRSFPMPTTLSHHVVLNEKGRKVWREDGPTEGVSLYFLSGVYKTHRLSTLQGAVHGKCMVSGVGTATRGRASFSAKTISKNTLRRERRYPFLSHVFPIKFSLHYINNTYYPL